MPADPFLHVLESPPDIVGEIAAIPVSTPAEALSKEQLTALIMKWHSESFEQGKQAGRLELQRELSGLLDRRFEKGRQHGRREAFTEMNGGAVDSPVAESV